MPVLTNIEIFPDRRVIKEPTSPTIIASRTAPGRAISEWSFLEAVAWVATRSDEVVRGIAPYHIEAAGIARQLSPNEPRTAAFIVASMLAETITEGFCQCDQKIACRSSVAEWNELSTEAQAAAASDTQSRWRALYIRAHTHICTCFDRAAQALFRAAAIGQIVATAGRQREPISRFPWQDADYDLMEGLRLGATRLDQVCFRPSAIRHLWPAAEDMAALPRKKGRPSANLQPIRDAFHQRRAQGIPLEASQLSEWAACITIAKYAGHVILPTPDTCRRRLGDLYRAARADKCG